MKNILTDDTGKVSYRFAKRFEHIMDAFEILLSLIVSVGFVLSLIPMIREMPSLISVSEGGTAYHLFLEYAFNMVVGIEFLKMLSKHSLGSVLDVLTFTIARHMILDSAGALENLLSIISISLIFLVRKYVDIRKHSHTPAAEHEGPAAAEAVQNTVSGKENS